MWADETPTLTYDPSTTSETLEPVAAMAREAGGAGPHRTGVTLSAEIDGIPAISTESVTAGPLLPSSLDSPTVGVPDRATGTVHGTLNGSGSYTVTTQPVRGTVTVEAGGGFTYVPTNAARLAAAQSSGAHFDSFTVTDGQTPVTVTVPVSAAQLQSGQPITVGTNPSGVAK